VKFTGKVVLAQFAMLLCSSFFCSWPAFVQLDDQTNNFPPFGAFNVGDFDTISCANGNVHFKIPLVSISDRNGSTQIFFLYDTPVYQLTELSL
jgi:hypothetical protein